MERPKRSPSSGSHKPRLSSAAGANIELTMPRRVTVAALLPLLFAPASIGAQEDVFVKAGTRIPLSLLSSLSTKRSRDGDPVYLETAFPVFIAGRLVIPKGSYVSGVVTDAKKAGRVSGKSELYIRFDSLTLPNGVTRDFRSRMRSSDGNSGQVDGREGKIIGDPAKTTDARTVVDNAGLGGAIGSVAGAAIGHPVAGIGVGAAAGAAAGIIGVLITRGPDVILPRGTTMEMVLDRDLCFRSVELGDIGAGEAKPGSPQLPQNLP